MKRLLAMVVGVMLSAGTAQGQTTWYVDDDTCPGARAGTEGDPFCSIQAGIDAAAVVNGDDVLVADGTYNELINFNGKAITVHSMNGAAVTAIDLGDFMPINQLIMAVADARLANIDAARVHLKEADAQWPDDLKFDGDFRPTAPAGLLWFESAAELRQLRTEADNTLAGLAP